jgi:hypothetical protein
VARNLIDKLRDTFRARSAAERDAPAEQGEPVSRETGGGSDVSTQDTNSSTGTTENETFVGRASGDEAGDVGESGSDRRSDVPMDQQGAGRPDPE